MKPSWKNDMTKRKFDSVHPGVVLAEDFVKGLEISQYRLAKGIAVSARRINEIVQGKRLSRRILHCGSASSSTWRRSSG
jgi:hypothetical protein